MPSFDITSKVDIQVIDNIINVVKKEIQNRFDFKGSQTEIDLNKKDAIINITTEDSMKVKSIEDVLFSRTIKQNVEVTVFDLSKEEYPSGQKVKKEIKIKQGLDKDTIRKINAEIKASKLKVESQGQDDQIRISAKKIDDLQSVIRLLRGKDFGTPLQFTNMK
jgi:uncharacterized protein YajQ (UPF0234 family)